MSSSNIKESVGKSWKNESYHASYAAADEKRHKLINIWKSSEQHSGMQVKVKFLPSRDQFVVKTRLHPDFEVKKEKKRGKSRRRNKKNSNDGKFDASASI
jgi:hypothetical protein